MGTSKEMGNGVQMPEQMSEISSLTWTRWQGQPAGRRPVSVQLDDCHKVGLQGDRGEASQHPTPPPKGSLHSPPSSVSAPEKEFGFLKTALQLPCVPSSADCLRDSLSNEGVREAREAHTCEVVSNT